MKFAAPKVEECKIGDEYFFLDSETGMPIHENIEEKWNIFVNWMKKVREENKDDPGSAAVVLGNELIKWAEIRDTHVLFLLMRTRWTAFRNTFLTPEAPPEIMEFVQNIMYDKMTEEQMWGKKE